MFLDLGRGEEGLIRFLHTADWQIGMKARHVAGAGKKVRAVRFDTIRHLLKVAVQRQADFIIVAGDIFEDNQVSNRLVHELLSILEQCSLDIYLLPGNHDPLTADSIYWRPTLVNNLPDNVHILTTYDRVQPLTGVIILPAPCFERKSNNDPTSHWAVAKDDAVKIGVAHGSLMIEGKYQTNDHPIALDTVLRQGLDYLALGHWHSLFSWDQRTYYCGTPEPTGFGELRGGNVLLVSIAGPGQVPEVEPIPVNNLIWEQWEYDLGIGLENILSLLKRRVGQLNKPEKTLVRLALVGHVSAVESTSIDEMVQWLNQRLFYLDLDQERLWAQPVTASLLNRARNQPFLQGLLTDLKVAAGILGTSLTDIPEDVVARAGPDPEIIDSLIQEGFGLEDIREAVRQLASLVEEV